MLYTVRGPVPLGPRFCASRRLASGSHGVCAMGETRSSSDDPTTEARAAPTAMTFRELGRLVSLMVRVRTVAVPGMLLLIAFLAVFDPVPWKLGLAAGAAVVFARLTVLGRRRFRGGEATPRDLLNVLLTVVGVQTVLIATTGGIESPFVVVYLPLVAVATSLALARTSHRVVLALAPVGLVLLFAIAELAGLRDLALPGIFRTCVGGPPSPAHTIVFALVLIGAMGAGTAIGAFLRRALDNSVQATVTARGEAVTTMRERNRELVELSGALAHELKNPLASIQGLAGLLARKLEPGSREAEQMSVLRGEVRRMGTILDEFLNFSRPAQSLATRPVTARALLWDLVALHEPMAAERGVRLTIRIDTEQPVACDSRKIKQVVVNLLQNALDATPTGGEVVVRAESEDGGMRLTVDDTGPGLSDEVRGRLFTPGTTTKAAGSGLGLTVARAITEQHGGSLSLIERPGGGCRAVVKLPAQPNAAAEQSFAK